MTRVTPDQQSADVNVREQNPLYQGEVWKAQVQAALLRARAGEVFIEALAEQVRIPLQEGRRVLVGADLSGLDLSGTDFGETRFEEVTFKRSDLQGANFAGTSLQSVCFHLADLRTAVFTGNFLLTDVDLSGANLEGAFLSYTIWTGGTLRGASLKGATFRRAELNGTLVDEGNLGETAEEDVVISR